jgi:hypothetical protein
MNHTVLVELRRAKVMAALKKTSIVLLLLAVMVILSTGVESAQAQPVPALTLGVITCNATAVPPVVRAEGIAELTGDIVLTCQNIPPPLNNGNPVAHLETNVSVSLNVNVTNNIDWGTDGITDAVLVINENNCTTPNTRGARFEGLHADACDVPDLRFQVPQFGRLAATNRLEWNRVAFPIPGAASNGLAGQDCLIVACNPGITSIRITSIRGNASQLGVPSSATFPSTQITAFVSITGPTTLPVTNNVLNVAVPILGLIVTSDKDAPIAGLQCIKDTGHTYLDLREGFATSFKTLGVATFTTGNTQWESGYYAIDEDGAASNKGAGASQGTRFLIRFFNIPQGVKVKVDNSINNGLVDETGDALWIKRVSGAASDGDDDPSSALLLAPPWSPFRAVLEQ